MLPQTGPCSPLSVRRPAAAAEGTRQPRLGLRTQTHCRCPCCCSRGISVHGIVVGVQRTVRASGIRLGELSCVRPRENPAASSAVRGQHCAQWTTGCGVGTSCMLVVVLSRCSDLCSRLGVMQHHAIASGVHNGGLVQELHVTTSFANHGEVGGAQLLHARAAARRRAPGVMVRTARVPD